jgi:hypothetical protein
MQYKAIEEIWRIINAETYKIIGEKRTELTPAKRLEAEM